LLTPAYGTPITSKSMVDISHESLMRIWVRLKNWVDDEADAVQMYVRLAEAASMYQVGKSGLWRPPDLQLALNWQAKHKPTLVWGQRYHPAFERTLVFLEYSKKEWETEQRIKELEQKRKLQRARRTALVLATATIISVLFLIYAFLQKLEADKQKIIAQQQSIEAQKQRDIAVGLQKLAEAERLKAERARAEAEANFKEAERQRGIAEQQKLLAEQNAELARKNERIANSEKLRAEENARIARENEDKARKAEADAKRKRYIAQAKAMALKSLELGSQVELEGLLAQQAYAFNTEYGGDEYDNDIYNGLYYALRNNDHPLTRSLPDNENVSPELQGHEYGAARSLITHREIMTFTLAEAMEK
jgi:hypothetical protein